MSTFWQGFIAGVIVIVIGIVLLRWLHLRSNTAWNKDFAASQEIYAAAMDAYERGDQAEWDRLSADFKRAALAMKQKYRT